MAEKLINREDISSKVQAQEEILQERLDKLRKMEQEIVAKEKAIKDKEKERKQIVLRLASSLWEDLAAWADEDIRSINGQIEYLLSECVRTRKKR